MNDLILLRRLLINDWVALKGMVAPEIREMLLDVVFTTTDGEIRMTGKCHSLRDKSEEVFSLTMHEHIKAGWWKEDNNGQTTWEPRNLGEEVTSQSLRSMLVHPRNIRLYADPRLKERMFTAQDILDNCTAIEFVKVIADNSTKRIVFAASAIYPCAIEMGATPERCDALLGGLVEMTPRVV